MKRTGHYSIILIIGFEGCKSYAVDHNPDFFLLLIIKPMVSWISLITFLVRASDKLVTYPFCDIIFFVLTVTFKIFVVV